MCAGGPTGTVPCTTNNGLLAGHYCPPGTSNRNGVICPAGACCESGYAPVACEALSGNYCPAGSSDCRGNICPRGQYCTGGSDQPRNCTSPGGSSCNSGATAPLQYTQCAPGTYCLGGSSPPISCNNLSPGFYCPSNNIVATGVACPVGYYCLGGSSVFPAFCSVSRGYYCPPQSPNASGVLCPEGYYCADSVILSCPFGFYCLTGDPLPPHQCAVGTGYYCPLRTHSASGVLCPEGYYCINMTILPCSDVSAGKYCAPGTSSKSWANCPAGRYCLGSLGSLGSLGATSVQCNVAGGFYCPANNALSTGLACLAKTYSLGGNASGCTKCLTPPGSYCPAGCSSPVGVPCPAGTMCVGQDSLPENCVAPNGYFCPAGTASNISCTAGHYCLGGSAQPVQLVDPTDSTHVGNCGTGCVPVLHLSGNDGCGFCMQRVCDNAGIVESHVCGQCMVPPPGYISVATQLGFNYCAYDSSTVESSVSCGPGYAYGWEGCKVCTCTAGFASTRQSSTSCIGTDGTCIQCVGYACSGGGIQPVPASCNISWYLPSGSTPTQRCLECPNGHTCGGGIAQPVGCCMPGYFFDGNGGAVCLVSLCTECPSNKRCAGYGAQPEPCSCPTGYTSNAVTSAVVTAHLSQR